MKRSPDVVIIGGGVIGVSVQYALAEAGIVNTKLLEMGTLASGSTGRSQAILRAHYSNEVTANLAWHSLKIFREFADIIGATSGYKKTGYVLAVGGDDAPAMRDNLSMHKRLGIDVSEVSSEDIRDICPGIRIEENEVFAFESEAGYADPYAVTTGYANKATQLGALIEESTEVISICVSGGRIRGVQPEKYFLDTDTVIVSAGPWSGSLLKKLGVDLGLRTVRHQVIILRRQDGLLTWHPIIGDVTNNYSARPDLSNLTMIGVGEDELVGPTDYNQGVDLQVVERASESIIRRFPSMERAFYSGGWSGLFTTTPDWHPVIGGIEGIEGMYCTVGFSGHGFKLAPMVGKVMSEIVIHGKSKTIDVSNLNAHRFERQELLRSRYGMQVLA